MNNHRILKEIIKALKELSKEMDEIKKSIKELDHRKLPQLLKKEAKVIEKLEKYAQTIKNTQTTNDINNMQRFSNNILQFPAIKEEENTYDIILIRHLYSELMRKVFIIGNLVEQHLTLYKIIYGNLLTPGAERPKPVWIDKKM